MPLDLDRGSTGRADDLARDDCSFRICPAADYLERLVGSEMCIRDSYKISDVSVDGISMAVTQRSEFASVIQHSGGQLQGLIAMLREKTGGAAARSP